MCKSGIFFREDMYCGLHGTLNTTVNRRRRRRWRLGVSVARNFTFYQNKNTHTHTLNIMQHNCISATTLKVRTESSLLLRLCVCMFFVVNRALRKMGLHRMVLVASFHIEMFDLICICMLQIIYIVSRITHSNRKEVEINSWKVFLLDVWATHTPIQTIMNRIYMENFENENEKRNGNNLCFVSD